ncbi:hypothetical protein C8R45DRAFT_969640 [Mycena sanguinolenta]|nr:hypothetical protein C8R45DRAFT_969640 [Mycena sanguinolenta]
MDGQNDLAVRASCCPTYVVALSGPWIAILGVVITSRCIVQRLTDYLWLGPRNCLLNDDHVLRIAQVLFALKQGLLRSEEENNDLETHLPSPGKLRNARFFPHPTSYTINGTTTRFVYVAPLERDGACVTFHCRTLEDNKDIVVKFVRFYGEAAQRLLANAGFAPHLLYYGDISSNASYGRVKMVVMDFVVGKNLGWLQEKKQKLPGRIGEQLATIVHTLRDAGFVHGDLRAPNVVVTDDLQEVLLLDFDWAGKVGEAFYPINLSSEVQWPPGAEGLGPIFFAHDEYMLEQIVGQLV